MAKYNRFYNFCGDFFFQLQVTYQKDIATDNPVASENKTQQELKSNSNTLKTPAVQSVMEMGYSEDIVMAAVRQAQEHGMYFKRYCNKNYYNLR